MAKGSTAGLLLVAISSSALAAKTEPARPPSPYPVNYEQLGKAYFERTLKDPYSAHIELIRGPRWTMVGEKTWLRGDNRVWAWAVCYHVNAKNSYGGYTGMHTDVLLIDHGEVVADLESPRDYYGNGEMIPNATVLSECDAPAAPPPAPGSTTSSAPGGFPSTN